MQSVVNTIQIYLQVQQQLPANFKVGNGSSHGASLQLMEDSDNGSNFVALKIDSIGSNLTLTLPSSDGSNGQVLGTNGSGVLSFVSTTSSIAGVLILISVQQVAVTFLSMTEVILLIMSQYQEMLL